MEKEVVDVAHAFENVVESDSVSTVCSRHTPAAFQHLKPQSLHSRIVVCDKEPSLHLPTNVSNPFCNLKIEVVTNTAKKRKLDESIDDGYETPQKQSFSPNTLSPDLGCAMDVCGPAVKLDSVSSFSIPLLHNSEPITSEVKRDVSSRPEGNKGTVSHTLQCEKVTLNLASAFDCDVNHLLCLSPTYTYAAVGVTDGVDKCKNSSSHIHLNEPAKIPMVSEEISENSRKKQIEVVDGEREDQNKETNLDKAEQVIETKLFKMKTTQSEDSPLLTVTSPPLRKVEETPVVESPSQTTTSSEPVAVVPPSHQTCEPAVPRPDHIIISTFNSENCTKRSTESQRTIIFNGEVDPEEEKQYVHLVTRHMNEKAGSQDANMELLNLMNSVADQTTGTDGRQWQHPSDLTRKNYKRLFGNRTGKMALDEWQAKNGQTSKRFANFTKLFERSVLL